MHKKLDSLAPSSGVTHQLKDAITQHLPGADVRVTSGSPGHFKLEVSSEQFRGKSRLECQRIVYKAIGALMKGERAPVHAIDQLETKTP